MSHEVLARRPAPGFRHEAVFYRNDAEYIAATLPFVRQGVAAGEPTLVAASPIKIALLSGELGRDTGAVEFVDILGVGRNPARIIPMWQSFVTRNKGRAVRGVGEPVWPGRTDDELAECVGHEALLNDSFAGAPLWLVCPYDSQQLAPEALQAARRTHPYVVADTTRVASAEYEADSLIALNTPLPEPTAVLARLTFEQSLGPVRRQVATHAADAGVDTERAEALSLAVSEAATNSVRHGGGRGAVRIWDNGRALVCEVRDAGRITEPLTGRIRPPVNAEAGRGLWLANQLCDLVQIRSTEEGTVVRLHMSTGGPAQTA